MIKFNTLCKKIIENVSGGADSAFGANGGGSAIGVPGGPGDIYAPGDSRIPSILGAKKKKKQKKKYVNRR
tara:strand:- start:1455 stop:1664 length:210 start_codon:yes stop_codon:yes gene_type:complete